MYEYEVSLIDFHIYIYIYINIIWNKLYTIQKYINILISNFTVKKLLRFLYVNLEICIEKSHIKSFVINVLNFCYSKYTNVKKSYELEVSIINFYIKIYYISMSISLKSNLYHIKYIKLLVRFIYQKRDCKLTKDIGFDLCVYSYVL